ncbi:alpha-amylase [Pseudomassariella vexata]|uniref:Alpha-amylase n=1 Tax=Pseudomassariella vexata TaxID=1141098 RepID=A0A1Y2E5T3_9PEZI|nr:alpha-amylase [Pseudomassariella vexata]ORY66225.1 alpha-amylase [Pseudomassariella vexata]
MPEENFCMLQGFEWNVPADQKHYLRLKNALQNLKDTGIDNIWLPPACKGAGGTQANGYDVYDLYDLGEFDQKGGKPTKWGSKEDLVALSEKAKEMGISLYFDAVLNHKAGADEKEMCQVQEVDTSDRTKDCGEPREMEAWLGFNFPGRDNKYSSQKYHWEHFSGTDYDAGNDKTGIYRILGDNKYWSSSVGNESGNADFLMFANVDYSHPEVQQDVINWGSWVVNELHLKGFRFDACQHFSERFTNNFVASLEKEFGKKALFLVGEFWSGDVDEMLKYLDQMHHNFSLYDSPMVYRFSEISRTEKADLRKVFDRTLVQARPESAVTVIMNHDTQPGQTVETPIEGFFKPLAYSLILLRAQGYPSIFYGDLYSMKGDNPEPPACGGKLPDIVLARKLYAYGSQEDYWDDPNCIGFVRRATDEHPDGLACIMSNAEAGEIKMAVGTMHSGEIWTDVLGWHTDEVHIDEDGYGIFPCAGVSVSIWVNKNAPGRERFGKFDDDIYSNA